MNRAERRRLERLGDNLWNKMVTGREVAGMMESFDHVAVAPMRYQVDLLVMWLALPWWERLWLRIRGENPFKDAPSLVERAQAIGSADAPGIISAEESIP